MSLCSGDVKRLRQFLKENGYFRIPTSEEKLRQEERSQRCLSLSGNKCSWYKATNLKLEYSDLGIDRHLKSISQFELDLSNGEDGKFISDLVSKGSDMEPIWGDGLISDPGEKLLPPGKGTNISEPTTHYFKSTNSADTRQHFITIDNEYGLACHEGGYFEIYDLNVLNSSESLIVPVRKFKIDLQFDHLSGDPKFTTESAQLITVAKRIDLFLGTEVLAIGTNNGYVLLFDATQFSHDSGCSQPMLKFSFGYSVSHVLGLDDTLSPLSLVIITSGKRLSLVGFVEECEDPVTLNLELPYEVQDIELLSPSKEGFPVVIQTKTNSLLSFLISREELKAGALMFDIIDSFTQSNNSWRGSASTSLITLTEEDFLPVPQYEFLTLCYNPDTKSRQLKRICQDSIILQSIPLYPTESNHLGIGSVLAHTKVPTPNYGLLYPNYSATDPINLRYFAYRLNSENHSNVYVNQKLQSYFTDFEDNFHLCRRIHGMGNSKVGGVDFKRLSSQQPYRKLGSQSASSLNLKRVCGDPVEKAMLPESIESLRMEQRGCNSLYNPRLLISFNKGFHILRAKFEFRFISLLNLPMKVNPPTKNIEPINAELMEEISAPLTELGEKINFEVAPYVDQLIKKCLQLITESRFDSDGPKFNSRISQRQFIFRIDSELTTSLCGADPIIVNASSEKLLPPEINCVDHPVDETILCHLKPLSYIVAASNSGFVFLFRLTSWRGLYAYRFEKMLNVIKLEDVCEESDEEGRNDFCQTTRLSSSELDSSLTSCAKCRIVVKHPSVHSLDYVYHSESNSVTLYISTPTTLSEYQIFA